VKRLSAALIALMLIVAACGDDDGGSDDPETQAAIEGLRAAIAESSEDPDASLQISDDEALCAAEGMFEQFGAARIIEASELEFEEFMAAATDDERRATIDLLFDCVDMKAAMMAEIGAQDGISEDSIDCLVDGMVGSEEFRDALATELAGTGEGLDDAAVMEIMFPLIFECFSAEDLANLG
jgi:hypothetical protein